MNQKHEWRKQEKNYYIPKKKPEVIEIEEFKFIQIKGEGNPNSEEFKNKIGALYPIAYTIKMMPRKGIEIDRYYDYTVYPLEGQWDIKEDKRHEEFNKDNLVYTIMIRQPNFVTKEIFESAVDMVKKKGENPLIDEVEFVSFKEGMCVQMMHIGSFDEEYKSFEMMEKYCEENELNIVTKVHREIYLSDFRKTAPEKLKTVLRYRVKKK